MWRFEKENDQRVAPTKPKNAKYGNLERDDRTRVAPYFVAGISAATRANTLHGNAEHLGVSGTFLWSLTVSSTVFRGDIVAQKDGVGRHGCAKIPKKPDASRDLPCAHAASHNHKGRLLILSRGKPNNSRRVAHKMA